MIRKLQMIKKTRLLFFCYLLLFPQQMGTVIAQSSAQMSLRASIGPGVSLYVSNIFTPNNSDFLVKAIPIDGKRVRVELSGSGPAVGQIPAKLTVQLRSNVEYRMEAVLLGTTGEIDSTEIGLGNLVASGARTSPVAVSNSQITNTFAVRNGVPSGSISLLAEPQMILRGPRISLGGGTMASTNALNADVAFNVTVKTNQRWTIFLELRMIPAIA